MKKPNEEVVVNKIKPKTVVKPMEINNKKLQIRSYWWDSKATVILLTIFFWPAGVYGWYMRSKNKKK